MIQQQTLLKVADNTGAKEQIGRSKYIKEDELDKFDEIDKALTKQLKALAMKGESDV